MVLDDSKWFAYNNKDYVYIVTSSAFGECKYFTQEGALTQIKALISAGRSYTFNVLDRY